MSSTASGIHHSAAEFHNHLKTALDDADEAEHENIVKDTIAMHVLRTSRGPSADSSYSYTSAQAIFSHNKKLLLQKTADFQAAFAGTNAAPAWTAASHGRLVHVNEQLSGEVNFFALNGAVVDTGDASKDIHRLVIFFSDAASGEKFGVFVGDATSQVLNFTTGSGSFDI
ncbi:hypothetical protein C8Q79DRAFT_925072 [Trametes meyenii]|nr:hypothetical protein C8Q79DRAFT_925072 [Trametes meyenii]